MSKLFEKTDDITIYLESLTFKDKNKLSKIFIKVLSIEFGVMGYGVECLFQQLYRGGQNYWWRKPQYQEKTTDLPQVTDKLLSHKWDLNSR